MPVIYKFFYRSYGLHWLLKYTQVIFRYNLYNFFTLLSKDRNVDGLFPEHFLSNHEPRFLWEKLDQQNLEKWYKLSVRFLDLILPHLSWFQGGNYPLKQIYSKFQWLINKFYEKEYVLTVYNSMAQCEQISITDKEENY